MQGGELIAWIAALLVAAAAAVLDWRGGRIPNALTAAGGLLGLALGWAVHGGWGLFAAAAGGLAAALVPLLMFRAGAMGGGDVKLLAALGALLGVGAAIEVESAVFLCGAAHGLVAWARRGQLAAGLKAAAGVAIPPARRRLRRDPRVGEAAALTIRFGPSVLCGTALALLVRIAG